MTGILLASVGNSYGPPPAAPVNTAVPVISGEAYVGGTLTSSTGTWTGSPTPSYTYQWQRGTSNISGATSSSYTIQAADLGYTLRCKVTATNAVGSAIAYSADTAAVVNPSAPVNTSAPFYAGIVEENFTLIVESNGGWSGLPSPSFSYQWQRGTSNISGATSDEYTVTSSDNGNSIRVKVTATNAYGTAVAYSASTNVYSPPMAYGTAYQGGYFGGEISSSANGVASYKLVVAPVSSGQTTLQYKTSRTADVGANSDWDGQSNSAAINDANHPAAQFCEGLTIGGYSDWYLPAIAELQVICAKLNPQGSPAIFRPTDFIMPKPANPDNDGLALPETSATDFQSGNAEAFTPDAYWSSTQATSISPLLAKYQIFSITVISGQYFKDSGELVRAVRRV